MPLVSVLIPFHNPGSFFEPALESVVNQRGTDFEIVLVENCSNNASIQIAKKFAVHHSNIKIVSESQKGIAFALNTGLQFCDGTFIARMDADDICLPGRLKMQSDFLLSHPDTDVVAGKVILTGSISENQGMTEYVNRINELTTHNDLYNFRFIDAAFAHPTVMFRKSLISKFGSYRTDNIPEDFELWLRWFSNEIRMHSIDAPVLQWRDHEQRLSRINSAYSNDAFDTIRTEYISKWIANNLADHRKIFVWGGGKLSRRKVKLLQLAGVKIDGFIDVNHDRVVDGFEVIHFKNLPPPGNLFVISMVSNRGKSDEIRDFLLTKGYQFEREFIMSA